MKLLKRILKYDGSASFARSWQLKLLGFQLRQQGPEWVGGQFFHFSEVSAGRILWVAEILYDLYWRQFLTREYRIREITSDFKSQQFDSANLMAVLRAEDRENQILSGQLNLTFLLRSVEGLVLAEIHIGAALQTQPLLERAGARPASI